MLYYDSFNSEETETKENEITYMKFRSLKVKEAKISGSYMFGALT